MHPRSPLVAGIFDGEVHKHGILCCHPSPVHVIQPQKTHGLVGDDRTVL